MEDNETMHDAASEEGERMELSGQLDGDDTKWNIDIATTTQFMISIDFLSHFSQQFCFM